MKKNFLLTVITLALGLLYYACGGGSGSGGSGTVPLYMTDDTGNFTQVVMTLNSVRLVHTSTGTSCDLLTEPESIDIANLEGVLQLLDTTECPIQPYNRVNIEFEKAVALMDVNGESGECLFGSYKTNDNPDQPNVLVCNDGVCVISINGGINTIADTVNPFALDFDLKNFVVNNFGLPECSVTMKVEPQNNNDIDKKIAAGYRKSVTGYVSALDVDADSFTLTTKKGSVFTVVYSLALYRGASQQGLDELLAYAADRGLRARVMAADIDVSGAGAISATTIYVKVAGMVSGLDNLNYLFNLGNTAKNIMIAVDYTNAFNFDKVEGTLADDVWVESKLFGFDLDTYFAHEVEVEEEDAVETDD